MCILTSLGRWKHADSSSCVISDAARSCLCAMTSDETRDRPHEKIHVSFPPNMQENAFSQNKNEKTNKGRGTRNDSCAFPSPGCETFPGRMKPNFCIVEKRKKRGHPHHARTICTAHGAGFYRGLGWAHSHPLALDLVDTLDGSIRAVAHKVLAALAEV